MAEEMKQGEMLNMNDEVPMMDAEEREIYRSLMERGIPEDMIIEIMATAKAEQLQGAVEGAGTASLTGAAINPTMFGGLPKGSSPAGNPSMTSPATGNPTTMNQDEMMMYLQNKAQEIRSRTGGNMGALSGVPAGNQTPMAMPTPRPEDLMQRQMPIGRDRTFNPMDQLTPTNAPNT